MGGRHRARHLLRDCPRSRLIPAGEVIVFEPAYDSYVPAIELNGGIPVFVTLDPQYETIDWNIVRSRITEKTKAIIVNTPRNPTGKVWKAADLQHGFGRAARFDRHQTTKFMNISFSMDRSTFPPHQFPHWPSGPFFAGRLVKHFATTGWKPGLLPAPLPS